MEVVQEVDPDNLPFLELPRGVLIARGAVFEVGNVCKRFRLTGRGLVVCDAVTREVAGNDVQAALSQSGIEADVAEIEGATDTSVDSVMGRLENRPAQFVVGVGGGRPIDVAKYVAWLKKVDFISVPTAASHDGIASSRASIEMDGRKKSVQARAPLAVIADTHVVAGSPFRLMVSGCADVISNYTAVLDWRLAHRLKGVWFSEYAAALSGMTAQLIMDKASYIRPKLDDAVEIVMKALVSSAVAMSFAGSSRPASGSEHLFAHALDATAAKPGLHGERTGVGTIMMAYLHGGDWEMIRDTLIALGAPVDADGLAVTDDELIEALLMAAGIRPDRYTILGDGLTKEAAVNLAHATRVIR